jgi:hypothetical protein
MRHISEQLVQFTHALLDIPDLCLSLDNQRVLEVDFILRRQTQLLLRLRLQLSELGRVLARRSGVFEGTAGCGGRCALLLEGLALDVLEFAQGSLELAGEFLLGVLL